MSETLKECEKVGWDSDGNHVATGRWRCSKDGREIKWESRVDGKLVEKVESAQGASAAGEFVEREHAAMRREAARQIEEHVGSH